MKGKTLALFSYLRKHKNRRTALILTIVALVEVIVIMMVSTSAWVESISSIKVFTTIQSDSNGTKGVVESLINQQVKMDENSSGVYDLSKYLRPSGAFHFAPASSTDGKTMYFPEHRGGNTNNFRIGNINDKNVNYISFTIRTKEDTPVSLAFDSAPKFSFGGTELTGENRKMVRFAIGDSTGTFKVYSMYPERFTESVPAAEDGTTETTTVYPFADYVKGKDRACQTKKDGTLTFSVWIQDPKPTATSSAVYHNKEFSVDSLKLIIVKPFVVKSTYKSGSTYTVDTNGVAGNVAIENSAYGKEATYYAVPGVKIDLHAVASEANGYQFMGWSNTLANTDVFDNSSVDPYEYTVSSSGNTPYAEVDGVPTLYAKFNDEHDLYLKPVFTHRGSVNNCRYAAFVFGPDPVTGAITGTWYSMSASSGYYKCTYKGSATSVIFCYMDPSETANNWDNRWLQTYDLSVPSRPGSYYYDVTCRQVLDDVTANGTTYDNPRNSEITESGSHDFGTNKLLGYWEHNYVNVQVDYTSNSDNNTNRIYCALTNTVKNQTTTELSSSNNHYHAWWYEDGTSVKLDGKEYQDYDGTTYLPITQYHYGKSVTLTAEDSSDMDFAGWYSDKAGTDLISANKEIEVTAPDNGTYSGTNTSLTKKYYAKYTRKPEQWYLRGIWDNWATPGIALSSTSTSNVIAASKELYPTNDNSNYTFKLYEATTQKWYSVNYTFKENYFGPQTLSASESNNAQLYVENRAKYTFNFNTSNHQLTIKRETIPTINISVDTQTKYGTMSSPGNTVKFNGESTTTTNTSKTYTTAEGSYTSVTVVASAGTYYDFAGWYENGSKVSSNASYNFNVTSSTKDRDLVAKFTQKTKTYYFEDTQDWPNAFYVYAYDSSNNKNAAWPGVEATYVTNRNGHDFYKETIWTKYTTFVMNNNNGKQTVDYPVSSFGSNNALWINSTKDGSGHYYIGGTWSN